jgi:hypothetical protein
MLAAGLRLLSLLAALVVMALGLASAAQARHSSHHHHHLRDYYSGDRDAHAGAGPSAPTQPQTGGFAAPTAQMIHACDEQATELKKMPVDAVLNAVQPSDAQRAALEQIRTAAIEAGNKLTASCPKDVPAKLPDRLDTMRTSLDAIKTALSPLRPAFVSAYAALDDEQKARIIVLSIAKPSSSTETQSAAAPAGSNTEDPTPPVALDCRQWPGMLKSWPLNRIEAQLSLSDEQQAALYTLMAAIYRAAASLAASCHDDNALTPVSRLDGELGRVDALHKSVDAMAPALAAFVNALSDEQNAQLNAVLGAAPQAQTTAR